MGAHPTNTENSESVVNKGSDEVAWGQQIYSPLNCLENVFDSRLRVHDIAYRDRVGYQQDAMGGVDGKVDSDSDGLRVQLLKSPSIDSERSYRLIHGKGKHVFGGSLALSRCHG
jgi:hypothetical protein